MKEGQLSAGQGRMKTTPIPVQRSRRRLDHAVLTSLQVGKMMPVAAFPLLREDRLETSRFRANFEMLETVEILMNAVNVRLMAYLVPYLAFPRFQGSMDQLNRSYAGEPQIDGGSVIPFFQTVAFDRDTMPIYTYMGKHAKDGDLVNTAYREAYNLIHNFRCKNRSPDLGERAIDTNSLARAFWLHQRFAHIVPDFDQAVIDGEVPLNVVDTLLPVKGLGFLNSSIGTAPGSNVSVRETGGSPNPTTYANAWVVDPSAAAGADAKGSLRVKKDPSSAWPMIHAELAENGITVSLSNIEMARKTQAFAALRKQYTGHSDDYIIDMLMNGLTVPEQSWAQPILLADKSTIFGMNKRFSSSADDLTASVVNGGTFIDLTIRTPTCPTGGIVMIVAEVVPEQLFERQMDPFMYTSQVSTLPEFLRDTLDPEKVEIVPNRYIDIDHDTPTATFGYAPLNHMWNNNGPGIGGKFYRPEVNTAFDEDRQRIWAVETENPTLSSDFYLCTNMHQKPFVVTDQDNFELVLRGAADITGNTVFGRMLVEASDDYDEVLAEAPQDRIDKDA